MTDEEQREFEKRHLTSSCRARVFSARTSAFAPMLKNFIEKALESFKRLRYVSYLEKNIITI